jgi:hypothetical protein
MCSGVEPQQAPMIYAGQLHEQSKRAAPDPFGCGFRWLLPLDPCARRSAGLPDDLQACSYDNCITIDPGWSGDVLDIGLEDYSWAQLSSVVEF